MLCYYNDLTVLLSTVFKELEFDIDYLGKPSKDCLELGIKNSPESWCFDTKIMMGQALEGIKRKNNIISLPGAWGGGERNCFVGYLTRGVMQKRLEKLTRKKINLWFFNLNPAEIMMSGYTAAYKNISELKKYSKIKFFRSRLMKAMVLGVKKMNLASDLKQKILTSPEIIDKQAVFKIYDRFMDEMIFVGDTQQKSEEIYKKAKSEIDSLKKVKLKKIIKIGLVGDYAHTLFSFNPFFDLERFILEQNIVVNQPLSFASYYNFLSPIYSIKNRKELSKIFPQNVSGSDAVTLLTSLYIKDKVDGIIHIRTFGCMPEEIVNEVLLNNKEKFPPILSLSYDAHTTEENFKVRIEAFIDMIKNKSR